MLFSLISVFIVSHFAVIKILSWLTFSIQQIRFHSAGIILRSRAVKLAYSILINVYVRPRGD